jgi:hypothetical protein
MVMNTISIIVSKLRQIQQLLEKSGFIVHGDGSIDLPKDRDKFHQNLILSLYVGKAVNCVDGQYCLPSSTPQHLSLQVA